MSQPPGFVDLNHPSHIRHLKKALYGLKQAPRTWYHELKQFLLANGFENSHSDTSLFLFKHMHFTIFLLVYVDDLIITGNNPTIVQKIVAQLASKFSIKDLGCLSYFLGIEVIPTPNAILLSQHKYIHDLLE